jgi:hypothetical protein
MKLGIVLPYSGADMSLPIDRVLEAERLGFDSVWTSEAYGSDAVTPAAWVLMIRLSVFLTKWPFGWTPGQARGDAYATELKRLRNRLRIFAGGIATFVECRCRTVKHCRS